MLRIARTTYLCAGSCRGHIIGPCDLKCLLRWHSSMVQGALLCKTDHACPHCSLIQWHLVPCYFPSSFSFGYASLLICPLHTLAFLPGFRSALCTSAFALHSW